MTQSGRNFYRIAGLLFFTAGLASLLLRLLAGEDIQRIFQNVLPDFQVDLAVLAYSLSFIACGLAAFVRQHGSLLLSGVCCFIWVMLVGRYQIIPISSVADPFSSIKGFAILYSFYLVPMLLILEITNQANWTAARAV